jgi:phospholipid transport system substrate-binding protein
MKRTCVAALMFIFLVPLAALSQEQDPRAVVQAHVDAVLKVLANPALKGEKGENKKKQEIRTEARKLFDFVELSRRTLGLSWNRFSLDQRKEFVSLYTQLLEDTYIERITAYSNEKVTFTNAVPLDANTVEVRSQVSTKTGQVPIYYRMLREENQWRVYDVVIEGVSLIANYRSQFRDILANRSPEALLATLRKRVGGGS